MEDEEVRGTAPAGRVEARADGRALRAKRTHRAVVEACLALIDEGDLRPSAPSVAERAGVSVRSVFQHFEDLETLYAAVAEVHAERLQPLLEPIDPLLPLDERIGRLVRRQAEILELGTPLRRSAEHLAPRSEGIRRRLAAGTRYLHRSVEQIFAAELAEVSDRDRAEVVHGLAAALSWFTWEHLRARQGCSEGRSRKVVERLVRAVLTTATGGSPGGAPATDPG